MIGRRCPDCNRKIPAGSGVKFDKQHNVICVQCGGMLLPAETAKERTEKVEKVSPLKKVRTAYYEDDAGDFAGHYPHADI